EPRRRANELDLGLQSQLAADVGNVRLDGALADVQLLADLAGGIALRGERRDLPLALGQCLDTSATRDLGTLSRGRPGEQVCRAARVEADYEAQDEIGGRLRYAGRQTHAAQRGGEHQLTESDDRHRQGEP